MYFFLLILVLSYNIILPIIVGADIYCLLVCCLTNILVYPINLHVLTIKTPINNPIIKDLAYSNYRYLSKTEYIVFECKKLLKYNIPWLFLILLPFIINFLIDRNIFNGMTNIDIFVIISFYNLAFLLAGISSVLKNFYPKYFLYFYFLLGNIFIWGISLDSTGKTKYLFYLSVFLNFFCYFIGILSIILEKKKKRSSIA